MSQRIRKFLKVTLIFIVAAILVCAIAIGILINFIFSPEKLTPKAVEIGNEYLDGSLDLKSVELTFFSSFPQLKIDLKQGLIRSPEGDSLIAFGTLSGNLYPLTILSGGEIKVDELTLLDPVIYAKIDKEGNLNWDILSDTSEADSLVVDESSEGNEAITINSIHVKNGSALFEDFSTSFRSDVQNFEIEGSIVFQNDQLRSNLQMDVGTLLLTLDDEPIVNPVTLALEVASTMDIQQNAFSIDTIGLHVINHELSIASQGTLSLDSTDAINVHLNSRLFTANIRQALDLIPLRYMDLEGFEGKGEVDLSANINGIYGKDELPVIKLNLDVTNGQASYKDFPKKVELFETSIGTRVDYTHKASSSIDLRSLKIASDGFSLDLNGHFTRILTDPHVILKGNGSLNFDDLLITIPIQGLDARGKASFDLSTDLYLQDVVNYNYGKIGTNGSFELTDMDIIYQDSIKFVTSSAKLKFGQDQNTNKLGQENVRLLHGNMVFSDLFLQVKKVANLETKKLRLNVKTTPLKDTTAISPVRTDIFLNNGLVSLCDSLSIRGQGIKGYLLLRSANNNAQIPLIRSVLTGKRFRIDNGSNFMNLMDFSYDFKFIKRKNKWPVNGDFRFGSLALFTTSFPKKIVIKNTGIGVTTNELSLDSATVQVGKSSMVLSGKVHDLQKSLFNQSSLKAELDVSSKSININQLTNILEKGALLEEENQTVLLDTSSVSADTASLETFVVPKNIDFKLKLNLKKVRYGKLLLKRVKGNLLIKDQAIRLRNLRMKTKAADMWMNANYVAKNQKRARASFNIKLTHMNVSNMMEVLPFMDTLLPMAKDFEGILNVGMIGKARIGKQMSVDESSLSAFGRLEGQKLVLLDGETFQYLAKTLKFKNREKNTLDTLSVEMVIENGSMEIFPSLVTMDRYKVAVGGVQNLDLSYNYHISVLKSPLPFKTGIDITGKGEDYDYKITKAKYKYIFSDKEKDQDKVDTELINRKNEILKKIQFED